MDEVKINVLNGEHAGLHTFRDSAAMYSWLFLYEVGKQDYVYA